MDALSIVRNVLGRPSGKALLDARSDRPPSAAARYFLDLRDHPARTLEVVPRSAQRSTARHERRYTYMYRGKNHMYRKRDFY